MTKLSSKARKKPVKLTKERQARALALIESGEFLCDVATQIGVTRQALFALRQRDEAFREAWNAAEEIGNQIQAAETEQEMDFRGRIGWLEPRFFEGHICGFVKKYSDALLLARMKALDPKRYGDRTSIEHAGEIKSPAAIAVPGALTPESWEEVAENMKKLGPPPLDAKSDEGD